MEDFEPIENYWSQITDEISDACKAYDETWIKRRRKLDSLTLIGLILQSAYSQNGHGYSTIIDRFWPLASQNISRLSQTSKISASSFCEARKKLGEDIFHDLNSRVVSSLEKQDLQRDVRRLYAIDATKINLPRDLIENGFKRPSMLSHYPQGLLSCLLDVNLQVAKDVKLCSNLSEREPVYDHLDALKIGDIVLYDRGYFSYEILLSHVTKNIDGIWRIKSKGNLEAIQKLIDQTRGNAIDADIDVCPTGRYKRTVASRIGGRQNIKPLSVRIVRYKIGTNVNFFATTLTEKHEYSPKKIADLYQKRWRLEEFFKTIKRITCLENFRGKSIQAVKQEVLAHVLIVSLTRMFTSFSEKSIVKRTIVNSNSKKNKFVPIRMFLPSISSTAYSYS